MLKRLFGLCCLALTAVAVAALLAKAQETLTYSGCGAALFLVLTAYAFFDEKKAKLSTRRDREFKIYDMSGTFTLGDGADRLRRQLQDDFSGRHFKIILNLGKVVKIDPVVVSTLKELAGVARQNNGDIQCYGLQVDDTLILTRLGKTIAVHGDEIEATTHFGSSATASAR